MVWLDPRLDQIVAVWISNDSTEFKELGPKLQRAVQAEAASRRLEGEWINGVKIKRVPNMASGKPLKNVRDWIVYNDSPFAAAIELGFTRTLKDGSLYTQKPLNAFRGAIAKL